MMNSLAGKISDSELEVMKVLWQAEEAIPVTEIRESLQKSRGWEATTVKTLVSRLVNKGVIRQEKRNVFYYSPLISEREYNAWATRMVPEAENRSTWLAVCCKVLVVNGGGALRNRRLFSTFATRHEVLFNIASSAAAASSALLTCSTGTD